MKIYNIDKNWDKIKPYLNEPLVQLALDLGMQLFTQCAPYQEPWPGPPWKFSDDDAWLYIACAKFEASEDYVKWLKWADEQEPKNLDEFELEAWYDSDAAQHIWTKYNELLENYYPQPDTPDWYRCIGAGQFLGAFNCALGMKIASHLDWKVVTGPKHTSAIGYEDKHSILCFDILWCHKTAGEILKGTRPILWRVPLGNDLAAIQHCLGKGAL